MVRPGAIMTLEVGSHDIDSSEGRQWRRALSRELIIAHVPLRTRERFAQRATNYGRAIAARPERFTGYQGWQWVRFATLAADGRIIEEFERQALDGEALGHLRSIHIVRSATDVLERPVPTIDSETLYREMAARAEPWLTLAGLVCRRAGIEPLGKLEHISGKGQYPAVHVPPESVVKLYGTWIRGHETWEREVEALTLLAQVPGLPVPRLLAHGALDETFRYVVMSQIRGTPLHRVGVTLDAEGRRDLAGWLGRFVRQLHAVPLDGTQRAAGWDRFEELALWRRQNAGRFMSARGFPPSLIEQLDDWLPSVSDLMSTPQEAVLCHGDLNATNLMGWLDETTFVPTGVIDFTQSFVGQPLADLGPLWWHGLDRDREALELFLAEAGWQSSNTPDFARHALAWSLMTPTWNRLDIPGLEAVSTLDALAERWFGHVEVIS